MYKDDPNLVRAITASGKGATELSIPCFGSIFRGEFENNTPVAPTPQKVGFLQNIFSKKCMTLHGQTLEKYRFEK